MATGLTKGEATRQKLLTKALILTETHGVDGLSMRQLATLSGLTPMAIYRHFPDKAALQEAVLVEAFVVFEDYLRDTLSADDVFDRLIELALGFMRFAIDKPHHFSLLFLTADNPRLTLARSTVIDASSPTFIILRKAVAACGFREAADKNGLNALTIDILAFAVGQAALRISGNLRDDRTQVLQQFETSFSRFIRSYALV